MIVTARQTESKERKNLISHSLATLRRERGLSQREFSYQLQLAGLDVDKNVIARIETNKRLVKDIELQVICEVLGITCDKLLIFLSLYPGFSATRVNPDGMGVRYGFRHFVLYQEFFLIT